MFENLEMVGLILLDVLVVVAIGLWVWRCGKRGIHETRRTDSSAD